MIPLYTQEEFQKANYKTLLPFKCKYCSITFYKPKSYTRLYLNPRQCQTGDYCSSKCSTASHFNQELVNCLECKKQFYKVLNQIKRSPNHFCSSSCSAKHTNKNKRHGCRISKLEIWLQEQLTILYPNLEIHYNRKDAINSELDIYIPSLNLAFELNGIFHYEPIFGAKKLEQTQTNDHSKSKACIDNQIDLCIIDTSGQNRFTPESSQKYLNIIIDIINNR